MRSPPSLRITIPASAIALLLLACGRSPAPILRDAGSLPDSGGHDLATGGITSGGVMGTGGQAGTGGTIATGGKPDTGGSFVASGGVSSTGGIVDTGGNLATGGRPGSGGTTATGGIANAGGAMATGGIVNTGGATATGGIASTGGVSTTGGTSVPVAFPPKFFGNTHTRDVIPSDFATYWDQFTPFDIGKWAWVQSQAAGTFSWSRLDAVYKYCEDNKILFKEHCFIWGPGQAAWINNDNAVVAAQAWMKAFCDRYPKTRIIDVVNEPLHNSPAYKEGLGGKGASGWDWVANSFKFAREACPNAILVLNDYNIIEYANENIRIIELTKAILAAGAPVMAIGAQAHNAAMVSLTTMQTYLANIVTQTGLPVYITELDLGAADDTKQATLLKDFVTTFWNDPNVPGITYWGYIVGQTWSANTGLISSTGTMRPAMTWLMDFLHR